MVGVSNKTGVLGAEQQSGAVAVGDAVAVGSTVQFQVRDADSAHEDLMGLMTGQAAHGALLFTCNGRGSHLFSESSHDATVVSELLDSVPISGMFCAGEIGPVGNRSLYTDTRPRLPCSMTIEGADGGLESISAVTLATQSMPKSVEFYRSLGFELASGGPKAEFTN